MADRAAGILLHPTSLPGRFGIGDIGPMAERFLDWLQSAGQSVWQVLPLGPTGHGSSPYGALSSFAGNPLLISPEKLVEELDRLVRLPGLSNIWIPPIRNRIDMLATGIKSPLGIKVAGNDLAGIERTAGEVERVVKGVPGVSSVLAERVRGGRYIEVKIDRAAAARYGLSISEVQSVVSAAITQLIVAMFATSVYPTIGASGGVFGLLLAYGMYFPNNRIMLLIPPIPLPARVFVVLYAVLELFLGVTGSQEGVAHFAHLGGMIGGYALLRFWRTGFGRSSR